MFNPNFAVFPLRIVLTALALLLGGAWWAASQTLGPEWMHWQTRYHQARAALENDPAAAESWLQRPLRIKQVEVTARLPGVPERPVRGFRGFLRENCLTCHEGLEPMSPSHPESFGCTVCHGGNGDSLEKDQAHADLIYDPRSGTGRRNPSALSVVHRSCGQAGCHAGHLDPTRNQVDRVRRSPMGTLAGVIAGLRYQWGAQALPQARYGVYAVDPLPGRPGTGLRALPFFARADRARAQRATDAGASQPARVSHHPADGLLRETCFQCHLDGAPLPGLFRGRGCAACHVPYSTNGRYLGLDPTIDPRAPGHVRQHRLVALPPARVCTQCHLAQRDPEPRSMAGTPPVLPAAGSPVPDVHKAAGLECIDCHPSSDVMGDGRLVSRQHEAVRVTCVTCHGSPGRFPRIIQVQSPEEAAVRESRHYAGEPVRPGDWLVISRRGAVLPNVRAEAPGRIVLKGKRTGELHEVPLIKDHPAHRIARHNERLACTACHSAWVPQCTGCHLNFDPAGRPHNPWSGFRFELTFRQPALMRGPDGKVRPMLPQPWRTLTALDARGHPVPVTTDEGDARGRYRDFPFTQPLGYSGANLAYATHPHSVPRRVRTCVSCHGSPQALGLGAERLIFGTARSGKRDRAISALRGRPYDGEIPPGALAKVTPRGQPVAGSHQPGARPFNQEELTRILRVGNCLPCHPTEADPIYQNLKASYAHADTVRHRKQMQSRMEVP